MPVSLPLLRSIVTTAPLTAEEARTEEWQEVSSCAAILRETDHATLVGDPRARADFEECRDYWLVEYPELSERTHSIITLSFSMLVRPFITQPLHQLFSEDMNLTPEDAFGGKIIVLDLPIQEFRLAGRIAQMVWKYCFQVAVLRRTQPKNGWLCPVFLWTDET